jgi:hypothetical protein
MQKSLGLGLGLAHFQMFDLVEKDSTIRESMMSWTTFVWRLPQNFDVLKS